MASKAQRFNFLLLLRRLIRRLDDLRVFSLQR
nr:MAG TPA: hypothetical protein [Caudoviricetes sp.]